MRLHLLPLLFIAIVLAAITFCTALAPNETSSIGGTGSEVVGVVESPDSSGTAKVKIGASPSIPVIGGAVFINPRTYLAPTDQAQEKSITTTRNDGSFSIKNVQPGNHLLYVRDNAGNAVAALVSVSPDEEVVDLGKLTVRKTAGVSIAYNGTIPGDVLFYLDVRGTGLQLKCTSRDLDVTLDKIPTGIEHVISIRILKPIERGYDLAPMNLLPSVISKLESIR